MTDKSIHVIKIGGRLINDPKMLMAFLDEFQKVEGYKILVHGGGRKTTELSALLGVETRIIEGRRITNADTLEIAIMVFAGLINKSMVAQLQSRQVNALGLCGADGDIIRSQKRPVKDIDFGYVGDIKNVDGKSLFNLMERGIVPVLSAITHDGQGQLLNTNADTIAAQTAIALTQYGEVSLSYCFEYLGVLYDLDEPQMTMSSINEGEFINMKTSGSINSGMIPKLSNGFDALKGKVSQVHICGIENLVSLHRASALAL